jgi:large subunit ribosomal protein L29
MKAAHLREKTRDDLVELQKELARDIFQNRLKNFTNRLDDTSVIRKTRRDLARVVTLLRERGAPPAVAANVTQGTSGGADAGGGETKAADAAAPTQATKKSSTKSSKKSEAKS